MNGCDGYQIAIEMRLHGAGDPAAGARLDAHLSGCNECRYFESTARETEDTMRRASQEIREAANWQKIRARLSKGWDWDMGWIGGWLFRRRMRNAEQVGLTQEGILELCRREVELRLLLNRCAAAGGWFFLGLWILAPLASGESFWSSNALASVTLLIMLLPIHFLVLPRLRRERKALS